MYRVIGGLLSSVIVWSALIGRCAIRCDDSDVGFEPRDSERDENIVIEERDVDLDASTMVPSEIVSTLEPEVDKFCDRCPECLTCVKKLPGPKKLPEFAQNDSFIILLSVEGTDPYVALKFAFAHGVIQRALHRHGVRPVRVWHRSCTLVVSMFEGAFPTCNCDPQPDDYQMLLGGIDILLTGHFHEFNCASEYCTLTIAESEGIVWYLYDNVTQPLLQKKDRSPHKVKLPSATEQVYFETVTHEEEGMETVKETFAALPRARLIELLLKFFVPLREENPSFTDLQTIMLDKIRGDKPPCYKIGNKPQFAYTFDNFFKMKKTR